MELESRVWNEADALPGVGLFQSCGVHAVQIVAVAHAGGCCHWKEVGGAPAVPHHQSVHGGFTLGCCHLWLCADTA